MNAPSERDAGRPLSQERIPDDVFAAMRRENLARWPTGSEVDLDEAVALHRALPKHKQLAWVLRRAVEERRCLTQPRGGFGTFALQLKLMETLDKEGLADVVPTTTDSYTRNEHFALAQRGVEESEREGRSMLNGYPLVNYGVSGQPAADRGDRQAGDHAHRNHDAQAHRRDRVRLRLFRLPRLGHRVHDVLHQGNDDRGRHPQLPVPRSPRRGVPGSAASSCTGGSPDF